MPASLREKLSDFAASHRFFGKGPLSVALVVTRHAKTMGLPLDPEKLVTGGGGQVLGMGRGAVQQILAAHGENRILAAEGGRTSRGSIGKMREYVAFLNELGTDTDLDEVEEFWVERVRAFFEARPFRLRVDPSHGLRRIVRGLVDQAVERQRRGAGTQYAGALLQHLVGAKLDCALGEGLVQHNSFSSADSPGGRQGDFEFEDVAVHVTTSPSEALVERCRQNLENGLRPVLVTVGRGAVAAETLADNVGLGERLDIFEIEQFLALNIYELSRFVPGARSSTLRRIINRYNQIVEMVETDPSLRIEVSN